MSPAAVEKGHTKIPIPDYPKDGSRGTREGGFVWGQVECPKKCTCAMCVPWRKKLGLSLQSKEGA